MEVILIFDFNTNNITVNSIEEVIGLVKNGKKYHLIDLEEPYIFFGKVLTVDNIEDFQDNLIYFLKNYSNDIKIFKSDDFFNCSIKKIEEIHVSLTYFYDSYFSKINIDMLIYKMKMYEYCITNILSSDFIINYIPNESIEISYKVEQRRI